MKKNQRELQAFRKRREINRLISIRDMRLKQGKTYEEIGNALKPKITRQGVHHLIKEHYPLLTLVDTDKFRKQLDAKYKLKVGTKVSVWLPIEATIKRVHKEYGYTLECSINRTKTQVSYYGDEHVIEIKPKIRKPYTCHA